MTSTDDLFYEHLPGFASFPEFIVLEHYSPLPPDWYLVIADIENSTAAISDGKYKDVNCVSAATIMAVLNAVSPIRVPYLFGGDGATFCVPGSRKQQVAAALLAAKQMAQQSFQLNLRIGMLPYKDITNAGYNILVGKFKPSLHFQQAMLIGDGIQYAERIIKNPSPGSPKYFIVPNGVKPDGNFEGFECRWDQIKSPSEEDVSIIIQAMVKNDKEKSNIYRDITNKIYEIYGAEHMHQPIKHENLRLALSPSKLSNEARIKSVQGGAGYFVALFRILLMVLAGYWMMKRNITTQTTEWGGYRQRLVNNTDYRRIENCLKMLIAGTRMQRDTLRAYLDTLKQSGKIVYGMHASAAATITCLVFNYNQDHIHFLDGSDGGFTLAASEMKSQIRAIEA